VSRHRRIGGSAVLSAPGAPHPAPRSERVLVLIVVHADGYVQVFGERDKVNVHVANALRIEPHEEILAEAFLDCTLPARYRALHLPRNLLAVAHVGDCRTAEAEQRRRWAVDFARACAALRAALAEETTR